MEKKKLNNYIIKTIKTRAKVKDLEIDFMEKVAIEKDSGEEIYIRDLEIENDIKLYDIYKQEKDLLTSFEIKRIRDKYDLTQKDFSKLLGFGEITIHRYENGTIQTEANNSIIKMADNPQLFLKLIEKHNESVDELIYSKLHSKIQDLINYSEHKIASFALNEISELDFKTESVYDVAVKTIQTYNSKIKEKNTKYKISLSKITNLALQKLLYFIQGISLAVAKRPAFNEQILCWDYGPVVKEIYHKYKNNGRNEIDEDNSIQLSQGLEKIIEIVVNSYGQFQAEKLIDITHEETPWKITEKDKEIQDQIIQNYFEKVYL